MTRRFPLGLIAGVIIGALVYHFTHHWNDTDRPVLTPGPCTMLGIAELADHPGQPFLVIDCEGFQFGVPAVLP